MVFGFWEMLLILLIVLVIFGAGKLPSVMGDLAKGIKSFKAGLAEPEAPAAHPVGEPAKLASPAPPPAAPEDKRGS